MKRLWLLVAVVVALLAVRALVFVASPPSPRSPPSPPNFIVTDPPKPLPEIVFADGENGSGSLADFRGKFVLLNLWATWCVPCRKEMPTLDRLQAQLGGPDFQVVALSIDRKGAEVVPRFYAEVGIRHLDVRFDASADATFKFGAVGLPTTLLIGRQGREIGRLIGPAEWDSPEMVEFLKSTIARKDGRSSSMPTEEKPQ